VKVGLTFREAQGDRSVVLGPASLAECMLQATGLVSCDGKECAHKPIEFQQEISDW